MIGRLLCTIGMHDYQWSVTMTEPQLNWQECTRCGHVEEEFRDHYERYTQTDTERDDDREIRTDGGTSSSDTEQSWRDVRRLLNDLKADGYQPTAVETDTSKARPSKSVLIRVKRPVEPGMEGSDDE